MTSLAAETAKPIPEGVHEFAVLSPEGDTKTTWDPNNPDEVESAREQFANWIKKGYAAYRVRRNGERGEQMREFDPAADKVIFAPALRGG